MLRIYLRSPYFIKFLYARVFLSLLGFHADIVSAAHMGTRLATHIPPSSLRYRVDGTHSIQVYLIVGKRIAHEIEIALMKIGKNLESFDTVLDFGCGCARVLRWFENRKCIFYGTDIDSQAIQWCSKNFDFGNFAVNKLHPPLEYADNTFDFIYAVSVFTHLNEKDQFQWLQELKRVLKCSGILILTVHGEEAQKNLLPEETEELQKNGFLYRITAWLPSCFQAAHHTREYVLSNYGQHFKIIDYIEKGINEHQDLVILQKLS